MRLNTKYSLKSDGSAPEVVDQLFGSAERKRARPESSLDIKVTNGETLARPPQKKKSQKDGKSVARENQNVGVRKKYEISDIERMTEDEILQALYDDPEFAIKAGEVAEKLRQNRATSNPGPKKNRKEITNSHPAHLRAMMEEGVPIKQWIILLVLLFAGLYQLRKVLVGSTTAKVKDSNLKKAGKKQPIRKEAKKKKERKAPSMAIPLKKSDKTSTDNPVVVRNAEEVVTTNKKKKVKKPPKQKELKNGTTIHESKTVDSPDSISTDGSSSMDGGADAKMQPTGEPSDKENQPNFNSISNPNGKNIVIPQTDEVTELNSKSCTKEKLVKKKKKKTTQEGNKIEVSSSSSSHSSPQPLNVITDDDNNKVTILEETLNIINDEALALEMHLQEEMLVQHEAKQAVAKSQQEEWEEVPTKKKKR